MLETLVYELNDEKESLTTCWLGSDLERKIDWLNVYWLIDLCYEKDPDVQLGYVWQMLMITAEQELLELNPYCNTGLTVTGDSFVPKETETTGLIGTLSMYLDVDWRNPTVRGQQQNLETGSELVEIK